MKILIFKCTCARALTETYTTTNLNIGSYNCMWHVVEIQMDVTLLVCLSGSSFEKQKLFITPAINLDFENVSFLY